MGRRIKGERFVYIRPLDKAQITANKLIVNTRYEDLFKYCNINKGGRVIVVDEYGREFKGKMEPGKNTYLHCLEWFQKHPYVHDGTNVLVSVSGDEKRRIFIGDLSDVRTLTRMASDLPPPPEKLVMKRGPGRPRKTPTAKNAGKRRRPNKK